MSESDIYLISTRESAWQKGYGQLETFREGIKKMVGLALSWPVDEDRSASEVGTTNSSQVEEMHVVVDDGPVSDGTPSAEEFFEVFSQM